MAYNNVNNSETLPGCADNKNLIEKDNDYIDISAGLNIVAKSWRLILCTTVLLTILSIIVVFFVLPEKYRSTARILPPQQDMGFMGMMGALSGGLAGIAGDILGKGTTSDLYAGILKCEAIKDRIIDRFNLISVYEDNYRVDTYKKLDDNIDIQTGKKDGIVSITVEDVDPKRAAAIANAFIEELEKITIKMNVQGASKNKEFLEQRLLKAKVDLDAAEDALKVFQRRNKLLDVTEQTKASIEGIAQLRAQLASQEVQLATLRQSMTDNSHEVMSIKSSIENLRVQVAKMEGSREGGALPNLGTVPQLGQEYLRIMRQFKIQEAIFDALTKQYEMAKFSESKEISSIQVIQFATVPDKHSTPKRAFIVIVSTILAFISAIITAFVMNHWREMSENDRDKWKNLCAYFKK
ncbi:GumC family protein [Geobacter benzoatilyticus]|uniref:Lipopolysaccharide biosynthesis protein n=1 Tax=Geobacter benzoatilyticus TaxID=2815309 RepID=A0ABX7Q0V3_9BACT|nr:Wzz/FepE/Etk N-terminal domain-containing protein [Geobacter benzoatilyticus]QSV44852.1 lipopolysaccharide biosynthesis protein [Geobacter benzoatilyticus]